jgi:pilus assembly protein FimV
LTAASTPAAPAAVKPKPVPPPPPEPGFLDEYGSTIGFLVFGLVVVGCAVMIFRRKKPVLPDFGAKLPSAGGFSNPFAKKAAPAPAPKAPPPAPPVLAPKKGPPGPPPMPKPQALKLGDTTALPDEPAQDATQEFARTQVSSTPLAGVNDTARLAPPPLPPKTPEPAQPKPGDTAVLAPPQRVLQESIPQATPPPLGGDGGDVDFDLTSQFEAQTLSINLDANDPLSEADFHLAYGLYDEAASLLKQALVKEPNRQDLRVKLAETYFAGGKPVEFQETAEALHGHVSPAEWQKIAIMGRQLSPDASLFKNDGTAAAPEVDLTLGDSIGPAAAQLMGAAPQTGGVIDFDLDHELAKSMPATPVAKPAPPAAAPKAEGEFDLSHFDLSTEPASPASENTIEFDLDELDLSKPASGGHITSGDEIGTKLDLARVYADMGDNDAARGLLNEVMGTGNATQKGEAEALLKRLSA